MAKDSARRRQSSKTRTRDCSPGCVEIRLWRSEARRGNEGWSRPMLRDVVTDARHLAELRERPLAEDVLGVDYIICLECGAAARTLPCHLRTHDLNSERYRERWGYPPTQALVPKSVSARLAEVRLKETPAARRRRIAAARRGGFLPKPGRSPEQRHSRRDIRTEEILRLAREGLTKPEIAARLGCCTATIRNRLKELGVHLSVRRTISAQQLMAARKEGLTLQAIANRFGCSKHLVDDRLREAGVRFDARDRRPDVIAAEVAQARRKGLSFPQLVARFDCGAPQLIHKLREANYRIVLSPADTGMSRSRRGGRRLRQVSAAAILPLLVEGLSVDQVASTLRCCSNVVRNRLAAAGLVPRRERPRHGRRPDVTVEQVRACLDEGLSIKATARRLLCSYTLVRSRLDQMSSETVS